MGLFLRDIEGRHSGPTSDPQQFRQLTIALLARALPAQAADQTWVLPGVGGVGPSLQSVGGKLRLDVSTKGSKVVSAADLGVLTAAGDLSKNLALTAESHQALRSTYRMTTAKQRDRSVFQQEIRLTFGNSSGSFALVVRVSDDGVAFRYTTQDGRTIHPAGATPIFAQPPSPRGIDVRE
jgi:hypothetical protein